jgi:predicted transcriptional regulator of viral defense system
MAGGDWHRTAHQAPQSTNRRVDPTIAARAGRQLHLITLAELREAGLSARGVRSRVARGRLHRVHRGVFCVHPPPLSVWQRYLAAVLACGPGSSLSDFSAAHHLAIAEQIAGTIHITNPGGAGRSLRGITVHRREIAACDRMILNGVPCTTAVRTVVDCAAAADEMELEDLLMAADSKRILNRRRLDELVAERRGQPGIHKLERLITDDPVETRSVNERRMFSICRRFGVSLPLVNHPIRTGGRLFYADFCWPEMNLIVEVDSWRWHGGRNAGESDADRDQILSLAGWRIVHFTRDQVKHRADQTGQRLLALTGSGSSRAPFDS